MTERERLHAEAIAEGYKDETCPRCGTLFEAHIHFIRCDASPCPMRSSSDARSFAEILLGGVDGEQVREEKP